MKAVGFPGSFNYGLVGRVGGVGAVQDQGLIVGEGLRQPVKLGEGP